MLSSAFPDTRWTLILAAGRDESQAANDALSELCRAYWYPLYAFVRRMGRPPDAAEDLTQDFFATFLERRQFSYADRERGRFRSFLLASMKRFLAQESIHRNAVKRGAGAPTLSLDIMDAERAYARNFADRDTPETVFEREWARTVISRVNAGVRTAFEREGRAEQFEQLQQFLPGGGGEVRYADAAQQLGTSEGALKVAVHRLRRRYREMFHAEIAHLVADPDEIQSEVQHLLQALRA